MPAERQAAARAIDDPRGGVVGLDAPREGRTLVFAITTHGYGHLSRSLELAAEVLRRREDLSIVVSSNAPPWMLERLPRPVASRRARYEPGAAQRSCFEVDVEGTHAAYAEFFRSRDALLRDELRFLESVEPCGVIADIPALAIRAASDLGIPALALGNFTWDWILDDYGLEAEAAALREDYRRAERWLRLPFGPDHGPFGVIEDAPLLGRRATLSREETLDRLDIDPERGPVVLVCVGGWGALGWSEISVAGCRGLQFIVVDELPLRVEAPLLRLPNELRPGLDFPDLVGAVDLVLTKPGYGIASECVIQRTPMVGIERREFREAPFLVDGLRAAGPFAEISLDAFFGGRWEPPIREVLESTRPWKPIAENGTERLAARVVELLSPAGDRKPPSVGAQRPG